MAVNITYNQDAFPVTYECSDLIESSAPSVLPIELMFLYDLVFPNYSTVNRARQFVESTLLAVIASRYGLSDGSACVGPPDDSALQLWLVSASSLPIDEPYTKSGNSDCYELQPSSSQDCVLLTGMMRAKVIGSTDTIELIQLIQEQLNSGAVTNGGKFTAKFLGTDFDVSPEAGKDGLPAPIQNQDTPNNNNDDKGKMGAVGIALIVGILATLCILAFIVVRRRRRNRVRELKDQQGAVDRAHMDHESALQGYDVDNRSTVSSSVGMRSRAGSGIFETEDGDVSVEFPAPVVYPNTYSFDVGNVMRTEVLGIHGTGAVCQISKRKSEVSLSENSDTDSWAQENGVLGSLELAIEPTDSEEV